MTIQIMHMWDKKETSITVRAERSESGFCPIKGVVRDRKTLISFRIHKPLKPFDTRRDLMEACIKHFGFNPRDFTFRKGAVQN